MTFATLQMCHDLLMERKSTMENAIKMAQKVKNERLDMMEANTDNNEAKRLYYEARERYRRLDDQYNDIVKALYDFEAHDFK